MVADDAPHAFGEDFGSAARQRIDAGLFHSAQAIFNGEFAAAGQVADLNHGQRLDVDSWEAFLESGDHLAVPLEIEFRMQAADDVELGDRLGIALAGAFPDVFERHLIGGGVTLLAPEGAELAGGDADVGRVDVPIDVVVGRIAVQTLAHDVSQVTETKQIVGAVEREAVVETEALLSGHLVCDRAELRVVEMRHHRRVPGSIRISRGIGKGRA